MMKNPFVLLARAISLHKYASKTPTGFMSLQKVHAATVFIDAEQSDSQNCADFVNAFFSKCGIKLNLFALSLSKEPVQIKGATMLLKKDVKWFGRPKRSAKHPAVDGKEDLFINLVGTGIYAADYSAMCSGARMKAGRVQPGREVYDLLILNSEDYTQSEVFKQITGILIQVK